MLLKIKEAYKALNIDVQTLIYFACKDTTMSQDFKNDLNQSENLDNAFDWIRVHSTWYQSTLLNKLIATPLLNNSEAKKLVTKYEETLKGYFLERTTYLPTIKEEEMVIVRIDDSWDREALRGEDLERSCKQIADVLEMEGGVTGSLHANQFLYISISS